jgi:hypothetical protein
MVDKIKREARERAARTGEPYTRARRAVANQPAAAADVPGAAGVPQPVAVMLARHARAARLHLGTWRALAEGSRALPRDSGPDREHPSGPAAPIAQAHRTAGLALLDLEGWSERTAMASGAITALPVVLGPATPDGTAAERALYPVPEGNPGRWCAEAGGHLPQPGEEHTEAEQASGLARHLLPGAVPVWHLSLYAEGRDVRRARDVVPGTPAAPVFDAAAALNSYVGGWMDRRGDSPADLAIALDGLAELADRLASVTGQVLGELARRVEAGTLDGTDAGALARVRERALGVLEESDPQGWTVNHLGRMFYEARRAVAGAAATLPDSDAARIPATLTRQMAGKTPAQVRGELGQEMFYQRQRGKTRPTSYDRAEALERILTWMHATGAATYDPAAHAAADPAVTGAPN